MIIISWIVSLWNNVWPILVAILAFLIMILVHEFGHFVAARAMGVRVNEFAIGFGPAIWTHEGKKTRYALRLIPFGGYCAMEGEDKESNDSAAFCNKAAWRRFIIVIAGAAFNILLGLILVAISLTSVKMFSTTRIAKFDDAATSCNYGLRAGDEIIEVDGRRIYTTYDMSYAFSGIKDDSVDLTVIRDGEKVELPGVVFDTAEEEGVRYLKIDFWVVGVEKTFGNYISQIFRTTFSYVRIVWLSIIDLIGGKFGINQLSGPVGVTVAVGSAAKEGFFTLLPIVTLVTVNLGIFNLLPIPALDGSRAIFLLIEMIARRPVPKKYEAGIHAVGFLLLMALILFITAKDIINLF